MLTPDGELIARHVGRDTVTRVLDAHFATGIDWFGADDQEAAARASPATGTRSSTKPGTPTRGHQLPAHIVTHRAEPGAPQGRQPRHLTCQNSGSHLVPVDSRGSTPPPGPTPTSTS